MSESIKIRVSRLEKAWLAETARSVDMSLSEFIRTAATMEARRVIASTTISTHDNGSGVE